MTEHPIMTIREVAEALKVAEKTVYAMASEGEIPAFRVRSQWRIRRVDFEAWLAKQLGHGTLPAADTSQSSPADERREVARDDSQSARPESQGRSEDTWERLPQEELQHRLVAALGSSVVTVHSQMDAKPFEIDLAPPLPHRVRIYMYNATRPPGGRPLGEHKIQLIVPGKGRGERASFNNDGRIVLLMGYAADEDVFILWDAGLYSEFAWSRNVQVKAETIIEASAGKLATQERQLRPATGKATVETVLAVKSRRLAEAIIRRMELTRERLLKD